MKDFAGINIYINKGDKMSNRYGINIWNEIRQCKTRAHIATWENFMGVHVPDSCVIHHIDQNPLNNNILNLVCMEKREHNRWHASHRSKDTKLKMSKAQKKRILSEEHRQKIGFANKGKKHTEASKIKMSKAQKGKHVSIETRNKIRETLKGTKLSIETKNKISKKLKGRIFSEEHNNKISQKLKGRTFSEEHRKNIGKAMQKIVICPYCKKQGSINNMHRYHFENCKYKDAS